VPCRAVPCRAVLRCDVPCSTLTPHIHVCFAPAGCALATAMHCPAPLCCASLRFAALQWSGVPRGFAFVTFRHAESAAGARAGGAAPHRQPRLWRSSSPRLKEEMARQSQPAAAAELNLIPGREEEGGEEATGEGGVPAPSRSSSPGPSSTGAAPLAEPTGGARCSVWH
jgi:hypothetical protein